MANIPGLSRKKWVAFALLSLGALAVWIYLFPLSHYLIWGSDTGEYYALSLRFMENGGRSGFHYNGWGVAYKEFPGMYYIIDMFQMLSGVSMLDTVRFLIPTLTAILAVGLIYILGREISGQRGVGIIAALVLTISFPHTFAASHTMAGTLGESMLLLFLTILTLHYTRHWSNRRGGMERTFGALIVVSVGLILTHHLTVFILIASLASTALFRQILKLHPPNNKPHIEAGLVVVVSWLALTYWLFFTQRFKTQILLSNLDVWGVWPVLYALPVAFALAVVFLGRFGLIIAPSAKDLRARTLRILAILILFVAFLTYTVFYAFPGTSVSLAPTEALIMLPFIAILTYATQGPSYIDMEEEGPTPVFMTLGLVLLFLFAALLIPTVIIPYRIGQYIMIPVSIICAAGIWNLNIDVLHHRGKRAFTFTSIVTALIIVSLSFSVYPPRAVMGGFEEGITQDEFTGVYWIGEHTSNNSTIASDHRMSSMIFGFAHRNATWDYAYYIFHGAEMDEFSSELKACRTPMGKKPVDYVYLSNPMKEGVALLQWEPAEPMSHGSVEKFQRYPFVRVYDDGTSTVYYVAF